MSQGDSPVSKGRFADLDMKDEVARQSEALARRSLNALAVTSNIVNALVQYPGPSSSEGEMVNAAKTMLSAADESANKLLTRLDLGSVSWARHRLMRMTTEAVANRWMSSARLDVTPNADIAGFLPVWQEMAKHDLPTFQFDRPVDDERVMMQLAVLDAMQPVLQEIANFDMFHDEAKAAMHARGKILAATNEALADLLPETASRQAHAQLLQGLLRNAGSVYASNWRRCAGEVVDFLSLLEPAEQNREVASRPGGWPLKDVDAGFLNTFSKLADMVSYLAQPAAGMDSHSGPEPDQGEHVQEAKVAQKADEQPALLQFTPPDHVFAPGVGSEDMDEEPFWDDEGPEMPNDPVFDATASMAEPIWGSPEKKTDSPGR